MFADIKKSINYGKNRIYAYNEEYCSWHQTGKFQSLIFQVDDENKKYYAYDFNNPQRLSKPIKVNVEKHTWVEVPDDIEFCYQKSLF